MGLEPSPAPRTAAGASPAWPLRSAATRLPPPSIAARRRCRPASGRAARRPIAAPPFRLPSALTPPRPPAASAGVPTPLAATTTAGCPSRILPWTPRRSVATEPASALLYAAPGAVEDVASRVSAASTARVVAGALPTAVSVATATDAVTPTDAATPTDTATPTDATTPTDAATPSDAVMRTALATPGRASASAFALWTPPPAASTTTTAGLRPGHVPPVTTASATRSAKTGTPIVPPPRSLGRCRCLRPGCAPPPRLRPPPAASGPSRSSTSRARPDSGSRHPRRPTLVETHMGSPRRPPPPNGVCPTGKPAASTTAPYLGSNTARPCNSRCSRACSPALPAAMSSNRGRSSRWSRARETR